MYKEDLALQVKAILKVLTAVDPDNETAVRELPIALQSVAELADQLYCAIVNENSSTVNERA